VPLSFYCDNFKFLTYNLARYITILLYAIKGSKQKKYFTIIIFITPTLLSSESHILGLMARHNHVEFTLFETYL